MHFVIVVFVLEFRKGELIIRRPTLTLGKQEKKFTTPLMTKRTNR